MTSEEWQDALLTTTMMVFINVTNGVVFFWYIDALLVDPKTRTRIFGVAYNIGAVFFSGTGPLLGSEFIKEFGTTAGSVLIGMWLSLLALNSLIWYCYAEKIGRAKWIEDLELEEEAESQLEEEREMLTANEVSDSDL